MVRRRNVVRSLGAALVGAAAGCTGSGGEGSTTEDRTKTESTTGNGTTTPTEATTESNAQDPPSFVDRLYAPSAVVELPNAGFASVDVGKLYDHLDSFPDWLGERVRAYDEKYDSVAVPEVGRLTAQTYWDGDRPSVGEDASLGGSLLVEGGIDGPGARETLQSILRATETPMQSRQSVGEYDVYSLQYGPNVTMEVGFGPDGIVGGVVSNGDAESRTALEAATGTSDPPGYDEAVPLASRLLDPIGDAPAVAGVRGDPSPYLAGAPEDAPLEPIRTGLEGVAAGTDFEGTEVRSTLVAAYESGATPTESEIEAVLAWGEDPGIAFERNQHRVVLETSAEDAPFGFIEQGIDPVEFSVLIAGAAFTPVVPWL